METVREMGSDSVIEFLWRWTLVHCGIMLPKVKTLQSADSAKPSTRGSIIRGASCGTNSDKPQSEISCSNSENAASDYVWTVHMKLSAAHNAARLVGFSQCSPEYQLSIFMKKGLQEMLRFCTVPAFAKIRVLNVAEGGTI